MLFGHSDEDHLFDTDDSIDDPNFQFRDHQKSDTETYLDIEDGLHEMDADVNRELDGLSRKRKRKEVSNVDTTEGKADAQPTAQSKEHMKEVHLGFVQCPDVQLDYDRSDELKSLLEHSSEDKQINVRPARYTI